VLLLRNWNNYAELVSFSKPLWPFSYWMHLIGSRSTAILYYDYLLTFRDEVEYFWKRSGRSLVAVLFYISRYFALLGNVPVLVFRFWSEHEIVSAILLIYSNIG